MEMKILSMQPLNSYRSIEKVEVPNGMITKIEENMLIPAEAI